MCDILIIDCGLGMPAFRKTQSNLDFSKLMLTPPWFSGSNSFYILKRSCTGGLSDPRKTLASNKTLQNQRGNHRWEKKVLRFMPCREHVMCRECAHDAKWADSESAKKIWLFEPFFCQNQITFYPRPGFSRLLARSSWGRVKKKQRNRFIEGYIFLHDFLLSSLFWKFAFLYLSLFCGN